MNRLPAPYRQLLLTWTLLMGVYTFLRLLFLAFNYSHFSTSAASHLSMAFLFGLRFDLVTITIINAPLAVLILAAGPWLHLPWVDRIRTVLFLGLNIPFLAANCVDLGLFQFSSRRLTADIFSIMGFGQDFTNTVPKMLSDFWLEVVILLFIILLLLLADRKFIRITSDVSPDSKTRFRPIAGMFALSILFVSFRGGIQLKPLSILSASGNGLQKETSLVLNSGFTILKTFGKQELHRVDFMSAEEADRLAPLIHVPVGDTLFRKKNVVVIIMEGIGKEYIGFLNNGSGQTPFLDSLFRKSLVFPQAFANGKRSIEGIPAVLAGIPSLCDQPFISSPYSGNSINSLASLLKPYGYASVFFHGGTNGTMNFDGFSSVAGFDRYFGRNEYADDAQFDGNWGIYDEPFLQRMALELDKTKQPFVAAVFTLSSHHPYKVPPPYDKELPKGPLPIHQSVRYADLSLRKFFETASKSEWFPNTLFVITADHTSLSAKPSYQTQVGIYSIPIAYYAPGSNLTGLNHRTTQQIDILPSVLDWLGYAAPFYSMGNSVFDSTTFAFAVNHLHGNFQYIHDGYAFTLDTLNGNSMYNYLTDSMLDQNILRYKPKTAAQLESRVKATVQQYTNSMLDNRMNVPLSSTTSR